ncbi:hypothetical protein BH10BAC2_BH10BAC2_16340 [soil metagenome]
MNLRYFNIFPFKISFILFIGDLIRVLPKRFKYNKYARLRRDFLRLNQKGFKPTYSKGAFSLYFSKRINRKCKVYLRAYTSDSNVFEQVIINEEYDAMYKMISSYNLTHNIKFIADAGANIGLTSIYFLAQFEAAQIIAIEPDDDNFKQLKLNIHVNGLENSIIALSKALWANSSDSLVITNDFRDGDSWSKSVVPQDAGNTAPTVSLITLADILALNENLKIIDLFKIDIEGAECTLFKNSHFLTLIHEHVRFLCLEIHEEAGCLELILNFLNSNNFEVIFENQTFFCANRNLLL